MESKHTPTPWKIERSGMYLTIQTNSWTIAEVFRSDYDSATVIQTQEANAKLIAAAPDLLEALLWYVENDDTDDTPHNEFYLNGLQRAKDAIAKATGELT